MSSMPPKPAPRVDARPRIASPCISVCRLDPFDDICAGCLRTTDEIASWTAYDDDERRRIMDSLQARRAQRRPPRLAGR